MDLPWVSSNAKKSRPTRYDQLVVYTYLIQASFLLYPLHVGPCTVRLSAYWHRNGGGDDAVFDSIGVFLARTRHIFTARLSLAIKSWLTEDAIENILCSIHHQLFSRILGSSQS